MEKIRSKRKSPRLKDYNYGKNGAYFITVCTQNRENIFSVIAEENAEAVLTEYGMIVEKWILELPEKYTSVFVDNYVIMPNHVHLLLTIADGLIEEKGKPSIASIMGWWKYQCSKEINEKRSSQGQSVFQRSFFDHIIRNQYDYDEIYNYIEENPLRWKWDRLYSDMKKAGAETTPLQ
ncbi:MAG: hypothetical protein E7332_01670 [Clostridiales bacterium]|nr:hypothetical protein [Clostridiales bacterium]